MERPENTDIDRAMKAESLRSELKRSALPLREHVKYALQQGCSAAYLASRYGLSVEDIEKAKRVWQL